MLKFLLLFIVSLVLFTQARVFSQSDREYVGDFRNNKVYYLKSSVSRGNIIYVITVLEPINTSIDDAGNEYEYLTYKCIFRTNNKNEIKCIVTNRIYYYKDKSYRKSDFPNVELSLSYDRIISDLYNKVR